MNDKGRVQSLEEQAYTSTDEYMREAIERIDKLYGEGYAKAHPELVASFMQVCAIDYASGIIWIALNSIEQDIKKLVSVMGKCELYDS